VVIPQSAAITVVAQSTMGGAVGLIVSGFSSSGVQAAMDLGKVSKWWKVR
jgi:hypothetical protein